MRKTPAWLALAAFMMFLIPQAYAERPSVELVSEIQNGGVTNRQVLSFIVQFDGDVTGFESSDVFALGETSEFLPHVANFRQISPSMYAFEIFRGPSSGPITISIPANSAFNADGMGNTASDQYVITIDVSRKVVIGLEYTFEGDIYGMEFSDDGRRLFISDDEEDSILQYKLARPFMLEGRIKAETLELGNTSVRGLTFSGDGRIMFVADEESDSILQYDLAEPYDIAGATMGGITNLTGSTTQPTSPQDILFSEIQSTMLITNGIQSIHRYELNAPYNVTSATYTESRHPANGDVDLSGMAFSRNGHKIFATGTDFLGIVQYLTSERESIRHAEFLSSYQQGGLSFRAIAFSNDGYRLFAVNADEPTIHEISLAVPYTLQNSEVIYVERLEDRDLREDFEPFTIDLTDHFTEIDGDVIIFELGNYDESVVNIIIDGNIMRISPVNDAYGETEIVILVGGRSVVYEEDFTITVHEVNDPPVNHIPFEDVEKMEDFEPFTVELDGRFFDRESDTLEYSVRALDKDVAETSIQGTTVTISSILNAHGNTTIRITANDTQDAVLADFNLLVIETDELPEGDEFENLVLKEDFGTEIIDVAGHFNTIGAEFAVLSDSDLVGLEINGGQLYITSVQDANGNTTVTIRAQLGTADREQDFEIIVTPVNDAPVPVEGRGEISLEEDFGTKRIGLEEYFTDVENDTLSYVAPDAGVIVGAGISGDVLELRSKPDLNGMERVQITASDGDLDAINHILVDVTPVNDPPHGELPSRYSLVENFEPRTINLDNIFGDVDGDSLQYTAEIRDIGIFGKIVDARLDGASLTILSIQNSTGLGMIIITAFDGEYTITREAGIVVRAGQTNIPPVDTPDDSLPDDAGPDDEPPDNPDLPGPGDDLPDIGIDDPPPTNTVDPVNNRPIADQSTDVIILEDFEDFEIDLDDHFFDPEDTNLTYALERTDTGTILVELGQAGLNVESIQDANGNNTVVVTASDSKGESVEKIFNFIITPVNDAPVAVGSFTDLERGEDFEEFTASLSGHYADVDGDTLIYTAVAVPEYVTFEITGESMAIMPVRNANGETVITVTADDGMETVEKQFAMQIGAVNDPPVLAIPFDDVMLNEDFGISRIPLEGHFTDVDSEPAYNISIDNPAATVSIEGGEIVIRSISNMYGTATITVTADGVPGAFELDVISVNDPPMATAILGGDIFEANFAPYEINLDDFFTDVDGDELTYTAGTEGGIITAEITQRSILGIGPVFDAHGGTAVSITISDGEAEISDRFTIRVNEPKRAPESITALPDLTLLEDFGTNSTDLSEYFTDMNGDELTYEVVATEDIVGAAIIGDTLVLSSIQDVNGNTTVTVTANDGNLDGQDDFELVVMPVNDAPVLDVEFQDMIVDEGFDVFEIGLDGHFTDVDGDELRYSVETDGGTVTAGIIRDNTLEVSPRGMAYGDVLITVTASDEEESTSGAFALEVRRINEVPTSLAIPDKIVDEDFEAFTVILADHFSDFDGDELEYTVTESETDIISHDVLEEVLTVSSIQDAYGNLTIAVTADDGIASVTESFDVTVRPVNDAPESLGLPNIARNEDFEAFTINLDAAFIDADGDELEYDYVIFGGSINVNITERSMLNISSIKDETRNPSIRITASDGLETVTELFILRISAVNDAPTLDEFSDVDVLEDFETIKIGLPEHFSDPDGDVLTYEVTVRDGVVAADITGDVLSIQSIRDIHGTDRLTVTAADAEETIQGSFDVIVGPVNDAPVLVTAFENIMRDEDFDSFEIEIESHFTDVDNDDLTYAATSDIDVVTVRIIDDMLEIAASSMEFGSATITVTASDGDEVASGSFVLRVNSVNDEPELNLQLQDRMEDEDFGSFTIDLSSHFSDPDGGSLDYTVTGQNGVVTADVSGNMLTVNSIQDLNGAATLTITASDGPESIRDSFEMTVTPVNDAPVLSSPFHDITRNEDFAAIMIDPSGNFTDVDGDELTYDVTIDGDNVATVGITDDKLEISSTAMAFGSATITVTARDNGGETASDTFVLRVDSVNDEPVLDLSLPDVTRDEDYGTITIDLSDHFSDPDGGNLDYAVDNQDGIITTGISGSILTVSSVLNVHGTATLTITASDETDSIEDSFVMTVNPVNDPPVLSSPFNDITRDEDFAAITIDPSGNFTDVDGDELTYGVTSDVDVVDVRITNNDMLEITAASMEFGSATITVTASDGDEVASGSFVLRVDSVNDVPVLDLSLPDVTRDEDFGSFTIGLSSHFSDPDGDNLDYTVTGQNGVVTTGVSGNILTINSIQDVHGAATLTITASDGEAAIQDIFEMIVMPINDAPVLSSPFHDITRNEDFGSFMIDLSGNFTDVDGDELTYAVAADVDVVTVRITDDNMLEITSTDMAFGGVTITVTARDVDGETASGTFVLTVNSINDVPVQGLELSDVIKDEDFASFEIDLSNHFSDPDGDDLDYTVTGQNGVVTADVSGNMLTVNSIRDLNGAATLTITAADGEASIQDEFEITVNPVNDLPTLVTPLDDIIRDEDFGTITIDLSEHFSDPDGDNLDYTVTGQGGVVTTDVSGNMLTVNSIRDLNGAATLTITAADGEASIQDEFEITVNPVNDLPTLVTPFDDIIRDEDFETFEIEIESHFADVDDDLTYDAASAGGAATVRITGANMLEISSTAMAFGDVTITVTARDNGGETASDTFTLRVDSVNDEPVLDLSLPDVTRNEDFGTITIDLSDHFSDPDGGGLDYTVTGQNGVVTADVSGNVLTVNSIRDLNGAATLTVTASDGPDSIQGSFEMTVTPVNDAPVLSSPFNDITRNEDFAAIMIDPSGNFTDVDGDELTYDVTIDGDNVATVGITDDMLEISSTSMAFGSATITVTARDNGGEATSDTFNLTVDSVNDTPIQGLELLNVIKDEDFASFEIDLSNHFSDPDGDNLDYTVTGQGGVVTTDVSGNVLTVNSIQDLNGVATLTVTASDGPESIQDSFEMTVTPVNDAPVLSSPFNDITRDEDFAAITIDPSGNFTDVDGDELTYGVTSDVDVVIVRITNDDMLEITAASMEFGSATITVTASDGDEVASGSFVLRVDSVNDVPVLDLSLPDVTRNEDFGTITIDLSNHFSDPDGGSLDYTVTGQNGVVTADVSGNVLTVNSIQDLNGAATLTITAADGEASIQDEFEITVNPINDPPTLATQFDDIIRDEDFGSFEIEIESHFADVDDDDLTYDVASAGGAATVQITGANMLEISSTSMAFGDVTITVTARDNGGETASDTFTLRVDSVNDAPVLDLSLPDVTRNEDFGTITIDLSDHFSDPDGGNLNYAVDNQDGIITTGISGSILTVSSVLNVHGTATLMITASDETDSIRDSFEMTVTPVNDAPVLSSPFHDITRNEDFDLFTIDPSGNFIDVDGDELTYDVTTVGSAATASIVNNMLEISSASMEFGSVTITVTATDEGGESASGTFVLTVDSVNDAPVLDLSLPDVTRDEDFGEFTIDLSDNFRDPDGTGLEYTVDESTGGIISFRIDGNTLTLDSIQNVHGNTTLTITASDGSESIRDEFKMTVTPVNDPPVLSSPFKDIMRDEDFEPFMIDPSGNFTDVDEDELTYAVVADMDVVTVRITDDNMLEITSTDMAFGSVTITVTASDEGGESASGMFVLMVNSVNDVPVQDLMIPDRMEDEDFDSFTIRLSDHFSDPDGDGLEYSASGQDGIVTANISGNVLTVGSIRDVNGAATLTITASDGPDSIQGSFEMTVTPVNDAPVLSSPFHDITRDEDFDAITIDPSRNFTDVDGDELTYDVTTVGSAATASIVNNMLEISSASMEFGSVTITVTATDEGGESASGTFVLRVDSVNDAPVLDIPLQDRTEDEDFGTITIGLSSHFSDPDGDNLDYTVTGQGGVVTADVSGNMLTVNSIQDLNGGATLTITASDGPESIRDSFEMTVTPVNDAPELSSPFNDITRDEDFAAITIDPSGNFTDVDGDELTYGVTSDVDVVAVRITNDDMLEITAASMEFGRATITVTATDGDGETASGTFVLRVDSVNDTPIQGLELSDVIKDEDFASFEIDLSKHFSDPDGDNLDYTVTGQNGVVTAYISESVLMMESIQDLNGAVTLTITATDGEATIQGSFEMTVTPVNDAPTLVTPFDDIMRDEDFDSFEIEVESHFADVDGDDLAYGATSDVDVVTVQITNNDMLDITAASMEFGSVTITVTATDGDGETASGMFVLRVDSVNDVPTRVLSLPDRTEDEDFGTITIDLSSHFSDPDGGSLDYTVTGQDGIVMASVSVNMLTINSIQDMNGAATLTITATDGEATIQDSFEMTVTPINDAPVLSSPFKDIMRNEDFAAFMIDLSGNFTDVDGDELMYTATIDGDDVATIEITDDMLEFSSTSMAFGSATITVTASDGDEVASDSFVLMVDSVNDPPVLGMSLPDVTRDEDFGVLAIDLSSHFSDPDGGSLDYTVMSQADVVTADVSGNILTISSIQDVHGAATLMITASDGPESIQDSFEMTVTPINDAPVLSSPFNDITRDEDFAAITIDPSGNFTDVDGDELTYTATSDVEVVTVRITNNDVLEITAASMEFGSVTITVTATDEGGESASGTFVLRVDSVNDAPVLDIPLQDRTEDEDFGVLLTDLSIHFSDPDGDALEYDVTGPASLISASASGKTLTLGSIPDLNGEATFEITATDGEVTIRDEFKMTVNPVNDAPTLVTPFDDLMRDESFASFEIEIESHFADVDGDVLEYSAVADGDAATVEITEANMLKISSAGMAFGDVEITITAGDGTESIIDTFILAVGYVNDVPVIDVPLRDVTMLEDFEPFEIRLGDHFRDPDGNDLAYEMVGMEPKILRAQISGDTMDIHSIKDANGNTMITVSASDGVNEIQDTMKVTVTPVTDPFRIIVPNISSSYPVAEPIRLQFLIADDEDITGPIVFSTVDDSDTGYGSITVDGVFEWTPEEDGEFDLMVTAIDVSDPRNTDMAMVALHVAESGDDGTNSQWRTKPTFGISYIWGDKLVDCGYSMDGICRDVLQYHVDYTEHIRTNSTHDFTLKTSAPNGLRMMGIGFGVDGIGFPVNTAEAQITVRLERDYDSDSTYRIAGTEYDDKNGIISHNAGVSIKREKCLPTDKEDTCVVLSIKDVTFREEMYDTPFVIHALDSKRYTTVHYMNDGLEVTGMSMNAPPQYNITRNVPGHSGTTDLTLIRTDKLADVWTDQLGYQWTKNSYGTWREITAPSPDMASACTDINKRSCDAFDAKMDWHTEKMEDLRDMAYGVRAPEFDGTGGR